MGIAAINRLTPAQHATVDAVLRRNRFADLDGMVRQLGLLDIFLSRSALHRYAVKLRKGKAVGPPQAFATMVIVVDSTTLKSVTIPVNASADIVQAHLASLQGLSTQP